MNVEVTKELTAMEVLDVLRDNGVVEKIWVVEHQIYVKLDETMCENARTYNLTDYTDLRELGYRLRFTHNNTIVFF